jgi:hypothetical protein
MQEWGMTNRDAEIVVVHIPISENITVQAGKRSADTSKVREV